MLFAYPTVDSEKSSLGTTVGKEPFVYRTVISFDLDSRKSKMQVWNCRPGSRATVSMRQFMIPTVDTTVVNQKCKFGTVGQIQDR